MMIGVRVYCRIFGAFNLKDKRSVMKSLLKKLAHRYNIAIAEVDLQDHIQKACFAIATLSHTENEGKSKLADLLKKAETYHPIEIYQTTWLYSVEEND